MVSPDKCVVHSVTSGFSQVALLNVSLRLQCQCLTVLSWAGSGNRTFGPDSGGAPTPASPLGSVVCQCGAP